MLISIGKYLRCQVRRTKMIESGNAQPTPNSCNTTDKGSRIGCIASFSFNTQTGAMTIVTQF